LSNEANKNELLDDMEIEADMSSAGLYQTKLSKPLAVLSQGSLRLDLLEPVQNAPAFPPLPALDLDCLCDILSF
jgi:hypothetical protein